MDSEWSEWFEHDGRGCPCRGQFVQIVNHKGRIREGMAGSQFGQNPELIDGSWNWGNWPFCTKIVRYRVRTPRALQQLREIANLRETVDA